jgi:hypothetical protein
MAQGILATTTWQAGLTPHSDWYTGTEHGGSPGQLQIVGDRFEAVVGIARQNDDLVMNHCRTHSRCEVSTSQCKPNT